ncbi:MAG: hydroxymethylglutaryl-CoA lyase, partial [Gammaproteobacteria bacterium]|nr:hydroxymethylglutaryl-CoA lyase [Gammaproteobacteria bacterium]
MSQKKVSVVEVSPRDGLQSEPEVLSTESKLEFIARAVDAGITRLEVASFVNPKKVPQMADSEELLAALPIVDGVSYIGLLMNERGLDRALETRVHEIGMVVVATDTYNQRNQGVPTNDSVEAWL